MVTPLKLGLDEALITVKSQISESLDVFYRLEECFGCAMDKLVTLTSKVDQFVLSTKHNLQLDLRVTPPSHVFGSNNQTSKLVACSFPDLSLNNHAHYRIVVTRKDLSPQFDCSLQTLDKGDCNLCPPAILLSLLLILTVCERFYTKYQTRKASQRRASVGRANKSINQEQQVSTNIDQSTDADGGVVVAPEAARQEALETNETKRKSKRVDSLDVFRGLTIAGMILVNYGGAGYTQLEHAAWDGISLADFVFPFFIFSMGASIALSAQSMVKSGRSLGYIGCKVLRRSFVLVLIGICLNSKWVPNGDLSQLRYTGVLQRFGVSYLVVAAMYNIELSLEKWIRAQSLYRSPVLSNLVGVLFELLVAINYLAIYLYFSFFFEYSTNCPAGYLGPGGQTEGGKYANCTGGAAAWLDRFLIGESHLYNDRELKQIFKTQQSHDPEGVLGYATSILLTLIGLQCGKTLIKFKSHKQRLLIFGQWVILLTLSMIAVVEIPINKRLWSLTFVSLTGGVAFIVIASLYVAFDVYRCQRPLIVRLLLAAGKNSIFLYAAHSLMSDMLPWYFAVDESSHLQLLLRLVWATFVWLLTANYMDKRRLFIKV